MSSKGLSESGGTEDSTRGSSVKPKGYHVEETFQDSNTISFSVSTRVWSSRRVRKVKVVKK